MTQEAVGTLYICPTPIGNLEDISDRARRVLEQVQVVAAEDTRHTGRLLASLGISARMVSYHEHNEVERTEELLDFLRQGLDVALVSDAGTPGISDPGYRIVSAAVEAGIHVVPIPGPVAALVALSASGLPTDRFAFLGFVPRKSGERRELLDRLLYTDMTAIVYESPQRLRKTLRELADVMPERRLVVARELTKQFEQFYRGTAADVADTFPTEDQRGEIVLLIEGAPAATELANEDLESLPIREQYDVLLAAGIKRMEAMKVIARGHGLPKNAVYRLLKD